MECHLHSSANWSCDLHTASLRLQFWQSICANSKFSDNLNYGLQSIQPLRNLWNAQSLWCVPHQSNFKLGVSLDHNASLFFVVLLAVRTFWITFQAKNNARSTPGSTALTLVLHWSHNACTTNYHLCGSWERSGEQRRTKLSFSRTVMQALDTVQKWCF